MPTSTHITDATGDNMMVGRVADRASVDRIAATPEEVWVALPEVYASLSIPVTLSDPASRTFGGQRAQVRRTLGKASLSRFLECGTLPQGKIADLYDVRLTVLTQVQGDDKQRTTVTTSVQAQARSATSNSGETSCSSTGVLEERISAALREKLKV